MWCIVAIFSTLLYNLDVMEITDCCACTSSTPPQTDSLRHLLSLHNDRQSCAAPGGRTGESPPNALYSMNE